MQHEKFIKLEPEQKEKILEKLNPSFSGSIFEPEHTVILSQKISFYPGYDLLDIIDHSSMPALRRIVIYSKDDNFILDYSSSQIYDLNKIIPLKLDTNTAEDYVRFFFKYARGEHGHFLIVENIDDISWKDDPPPNARKAVGKMISPLSLIARDEHGFYVLSSCMIFKDSLFKTKITLDLNGIVSISDEHLLLEDIPVLDEIFGQ